MEIKIPLKDLAVLFAKSASNPELPEPIRQFAAQLTVLTAHVERNELRLKKEYQARKLLDQNLAQLADIVLKTGASVPGAVAAPGAAPVVEAPLSEEDEAQALADKVNAEAQAEIDAINNASPLAPIRKNGGQKPVSVEEAS